MNGATYCQALKWKHVDYTVREEVVSSQRFGIKRMRGNEFETMVGGIDFPDQVSGRKEMQSVHNYDILSNPHYCDLLLYVPCIIPKRSAFVISPYRDVHMRVYAADLVRSVLDLPYLPQPLAQKFEFSVEYMATLSQGKRKMEKIESLVDFNDRLNSAQS